MVTDYTKTLTRMRLNNLFLQDPVRLLHEQRAVFPGMYEEFKNIVLWGAGELGKRTAAGLQGTGINVFFTDSNEDLWGTQIELESGGKIPCVSPGEAKFKFKKALYVPTVFNPSRAMEDIIHHRLKPYCDAATLYRAFPGTLSPYGGFVDDPGVILKDAGYIRAVLDHFEDDLSRREYVNLFGWLLSTSLDSLQPHSDIKDIYFPSEIAPLDDEVFLDVGAYNGDTIDRFLKLRKPHQFKHIYAFEPNTQNYAALLNYLSQLENDYRARISVKGFALGDADYITAMQGAGPSAALNGGWTIHSRKVSVCRLDDIRDQIPVKITYVKIDAEGSESAVLRGMRKAIADEMPVIAICLYHKVTDLWEIPLLIRQINPAYKFLFRHYAEDCWETVLYAVPEERLLLS